MNHFGNTNTNNNNNTHSLSTSAISLLSDDIEMNRMYMEQERMNDEYMHSLLSFVHDVEARHNKKSTCSNDRLYQSKHYTNYNDRINHYHSMSPSTIPISTPTPVIDQQRLPLYTSKIPHRRLNYVLSTFVQYFKRAHIPTVVYVVNDPCDGNLNDFFAEPTIQTATTKEEKTHPNAPKSAAMDMKQSTPTNMKQSTKSSQLYTSPCQSFYSNKTLQISNTNYKQHHTLNVDTNKGNMNHRTNFDTLLVENSRHRRSNYIIS